MESRNKQSVQARSIGMLIFECVMAVLYLSFGAVFLFTPYVSAVSGWYRIAFGLLLGVYGVFRIIRAIKKVSLRK